MGVAIILALICLFFSGTTAYFLYSDNSGMASVFATLIGVPLAILIAVVPLLLNKYQKKTLTGRYLNDDHFVDRNVEYSKLENLIKGNSDRIIYITGNVGMGKTMFMKMSCDRINYIDRKKWKSYAAFYFSNNHTKSLSQAISDNLFGHSHASESEISNQLNEATLQKNIILFVDGIYEIELNECKEFAKAFTKCNKNNRIVIAVDSNDASDIYPGEFRENEVKLLAQSYNIEITPSDISEISELSKGYPVYARYSIEAYTKGKKVVNYNDLQTYIEVLVKSLSDLEKSILSLIICLSLLSQNELETDTLCGIDNRITKTLIKRLVTCSLISIDKEKIFTDKLISLSCLEFLSEYKNESYKKIYQYYKGMVHDSYIALVAALKANFEYDHHLIKDILHKQYTDSRFYLLIDIGEMEIRGQINPHLREDEECWFYVRYYCLKSLLELGLYDRAREVVDNYDTHFNILNINDEVAFEYQYLQVDLDHLTNYFEDAITFSEALLQKATNELQKARCQYLHAHCLRHVGEDLDYAFDIFSDLADNTSYKDDKIRIRSIYSAASIKMFQGELNYSYEKDFDRIEAIMYADEKNETWKPYVARHKAIYEYKIHKNLDRAEEILQHTIHLLEVTPLRIKYDIYFELAEIYRLKECNKKNYEQSRNFYSEAVQFAVRVRDYNLESNAQLGLMLLNLKYDYDVTNDVLKSIISKTHELGLNINYNYAIYVKYLLNNESIPKELEFYWRKMKYSDLISLVSESKSEKCNLKLTVM